LIPVPTIDAMDVFLKETAQFGNLYLNDDQEAAILDGAVRPAPRCSEPRPMRWPSSRARARGSAR
jgi:hypothetical protein